MRPLQAAGFAGSAQNAVYDALRRAIIQNRFEPGDRLQAADLAARLGVSVTPVREALIRLQGDGLVVCRPNRGAVVAPLSVREVRDLYETRSALEGLAAGLAAARAERTHLDALRRAAGRLVPPQTDGRDAGEIVQLNREFHLAVVTASGNPVLLDLLRGILDRIQRFRNLYHDLLPRLAEAYEEHLAIVEAIERHDAAEAEARMRRNVLAAAAAVVAHIEALEPSRLHGSASLLLPRRDARRR
jgi:DNA-binding GntR family transcriptional regulator